MFWETVRLAVRAIRRNVLRSSLTVLGIVIGVGAVIAMVTIGRGATVQVTADVAKLGSNLLMVRPGQTPRMGGAAPGAAQPFDRADVAAIEADLIDVRAVAPAAATTMTASFGSAHYTTNVTGTDERYLVARDWSIALGRSFHDSEVRAGQPICILGETVRDELFGAGDPLGEKIRLKSVSCTVIGVLAPKGVSSFGTDQDAIVLMPLRAFQRRIAGNRDVALIYVSVREGVTTEKVQRDLEFLLRERRRIRPTEEDDFFVMDMKEIASVLTGITTVLTGLLGAVAAVSLLVGGIGIMNIMLVSVTERTREIGIRLAVGAAERQVLMQFLVEAVVLSMFGGLIGVLAGLGFAFLGARVMQVPFVFDPGIVVTAFAFSALVGIVFGYFPARRAARMDPIEALRHE